MSKPLKYGLIGAGAFLLLLVILPFLIPAGAYRARIEQAAFDRTGRELKINGALRVTLFPSLGVRAYDVTFANVRGGKAPFMAKMDDVRVGVRLLPLLTGHIAVDEIVVDNPVIALERDAAGHGNWTFISAAPDDKDSHFNARFSGIRIEGGQVSYRNAGGKVRSVDHADLTIGLTSVDKPVTVDGDLTYRGRRVSVVARIANLAPLKADQNRDTEVSMTSDLLQASFKGDVTASGDVEGNAKLDTTNLRGVAQWLGEGLPEDSGFKTLSLEARLETKDDTISLPEESVRLDGMTVTGKLGADLSGERPSITGDVVVDRLDLNRYIDAPKSSVGHAPAEKGWSKEPIRLAVLKLFDANIAIDTGALRLKGLHVNKTHLVATLNNGLLNVALDPMAFYGGTGKAQLTVDAHGPVPLYQNTLAFDGASMRALLNDSLNVQRISGRGTLSFSVASQGDSADAIIRNLQGKGSLKITNGRIAGVDLGEIARLIRTALTLQATSQDAETRFSDMGGSFAIAHGVLATKDFHLTGPVLHATGAGTIDLGNRNIEFLLKPKMVLLPVGGLGVGVPFRIHGPWTSVSYSADVAGAVTGLVTDVFKGAVSAPGAAVDFLTGKDKQKPNGKTKKKSSLLGGLFGH